MTPQTKKYLLAGAVVVGISGIVYFMLKKKKTSLPVNATIDNIDVTPDPIAVSAQDVQDFYSNGSGSVMSVINTINNKYDNIKSLINNNLSPLTISTATSRSLYDSNLKSLSDFCDLNKSLISSGAPAAIKDNNTKMIAIIDTLSKAQLDTKYSAYSYLGQIRSILFGINDFDLIGLSGDKTAA